MAGMPASNTYTPKQLEKCCKLIQQGPAVGIHAIWCDRMGTIGAVVGGGDIQNAMAQFSHRGIADECR